MAFVKVYYVYEDGSAVTHSGLGDTDADLPVTGLQPGSIHTTKDGRAWVAKSATALNELASIDHRFALRADITPPQLSADVNDYNPTGLSTASVLRLSSDAARNITGIDGGTDGRYLLVLNIGAFNITLRNQDAASGAQKRFILPADRVLAPEQGVALWYDATVGYWRAIS